MDHATRSEIHVAIAHLALASDFTTGPDRQTLIQALRMLLDLTGDTEDVEGALTRGLHVGSMTH